MKVKFYILATIALAGSTLLIGCKDSVDAEAERATQARDAQAQQMKSAGMGGKSPTDMAQKSVDMAAKAGPGNAPAPSGK
jgi:hypothetical protein